VCLPTVYLAILSTTRLIVGYSHDFSIEFPGLPLVLRVASVYYCSVRVPGDSEQIYVLRGTSSRG
jgi:hypothetical protein